MKKFLTTLTASALAFGMIVPMAACGGNFAGATIALDVDVTQNRPTLSGLFPAPGMTDSEFNNSGTAKLLEEITGYKVKYSQISGGNEESEVGNALMSQDTYSFIKCGRGSFDQYVTEDAFLDLTDALKTYGQDLLATIDQELWDACTYNGKIYAIPEYGFGYMQDSAIVFNKKHLAKVGITKIPETLTEFTDALHALQAEFGKNDVNYHALAIAGSDADFSIISSTFEMPCEFYEDENGQVKNYIYSDAADKYFKYMNEEITQKNCLPKNWDTAQGSQVMTWFTNENISVAQIPYWNFNPLCGQMAANPKLGYASAEEAREDLGWATRIKGDGSYGSVVQEKGRMRGIGDIGYMIALPVRAVNQAPYALDWMNQKIKDENYKAFLLGKEGVSHNIIPEAEKQDGDIGIQEEDGSTTYYRLLPGYKEVEGNSMYTTGGNPKMGRKYWPLREASYDCWPILLPEEEDDLMILSVLGKCAVLPKWSKVSMQTRSWILTNVQKIIKASGSSEKTTYSYLLKATQDNLPKMYLKADVMSQIQEWYDANRRNH